METFSLRGRRSPTFTKPRRASTDGCSDGKSVLTRFHEHRLSLEARTRPLATSVNVAEAQFCTRTYSSDFT